MHVVPKHDGTPKQTVDLCSLNSPFKIDIIFTLNSYILLYLSVVKQWWSWEEMNMNLHLDYSPQQLIAVKMGGRLSLHDSGF